jgi:hypothetical protein
MLNLSGEAAPPVSGTGPNIAADAFSLEAGRDASPLIAAQVSFEGGKKLTWRVHPSMSPSTRGHLYESTVASVLFSSKGA